ncbi:hypothetical protein HNP46_000536 [Pseudomonas nitritireducens]|uniref:Uncharacterized protein n=1 Tax=Pseudomonas nitroreducens TaxID=46680 RepID=A0A7W7NZV9_PSENT|nr:hypothetical protein [Pseudomonas nitritireducens]MBB4861725.1 hypothetical protein [Pseudomonas nitritireducens]
MLKMIVQVLCFALLGLSSFASAGGERFSSQSVGELMFPGDTSTAKFRNFTDCKAEDRSYVCYRTVPTSLFGVPAVKAWVTFTGADNFAEELPAMETPPVDGLPFDKLSYRGVSLTVSSPDLLRKALNMNGWTVGEKGETLVYFRESFRVKIYVHGSSVNLMPATDSEVQGQFAIYAKRLHEESMGSSKGKSFTDFMKP